MQGGNDRLTLPTDEVDRVIVGLLVRFKYLERYGGLHPLACATPGEGKSLQEVHTRSMPLRPPRFLMESAISPLPPSCCDASRASCARGNESRVVRRCIGSLAPVAESASSSERSAILGLFSFARFYLNELPWPQAKLVDQGLGDRPDVL